MSTINVKLNLTFNKLQPLMNSICRWWMRFSEIVDEKLVKPRRWIYFIYAQTPIEYKSLISLTGILVLLYKVSTDVSKHDIHHPLIYTTVVSLSALVVLLPFIAAFLIKKVIKHKGGDFILNDCASLTPGELYQLNARRTLGKEKFRLATTDDIDEIMELHTVSYRRTLWAGDTRDRRNWKFETIKKNNHSVMLTYPTITDEESSVKAIGFTHIIPVTERLWDKYKDGRIQLEKIDPTLICSQGELQKDKTCYGLIVVAIGFPSSKPSQRLSKAEKQEQREILGREVIEALANHLDVFCRNEFRKKQRIPVLIQTLDSNMQAYFGEHLINVSGKTKDLIPLYHFKLQNPYERDQFLFSQKFFIASQIFQLLVDDINAGDFEFTFQTENQSFPDESGRLNAAAFRRKIWRERRVSLSRIRNEKTLRNQAHVLKNPFSIQLISKKLTEEDVGKDLEKRHFGFTHIVPVNEEIWGEYECGRKDDTLFFDDNVISCDVTDPKELYGLIIFSAAAVNKISFPDDADYRASVGEMLEQAIVRHLSIYCRKQFHGFENIRVMFKHWDTNFLRSFLPYSRNLYADHDPKTIHLVVKNPYYGLDINDLHDSTDPTCSSPPSPTDYIQFDLLS